MRFGGNRSVRSCCRHGLSVLEAALCRTRTVRGIGRSVRDLSSLRDYFKVSDLFQSESGYVGRKDRCSGCFVPDVTLAGVVNVVNVTRGACVKKRSEF